MTPNADYAGTPECTCAAVVWACSSRCWQEGGPHDDSCYPIHGKSCPSHNGRSEARSSEEHADSGRVIAPRASAVVWYWESEQRWMVSVRPPKSFELDLGRFRTAHDAIGLLNRWADQRRLVVIPTAPWADGEVNKFDIRPLSQNGRSET